MSRVRSYLELVAIGSVARHRRQWLSRDFGRAEARAFASRPERSVAAALALKRAAARLFADLCPSRSFSPRDFRITHARSGAPRLAAFPTLRALSRAALRRGLHVSAAHTSERACGLVVYAGEES
jgi:phosphopantetheinyl transferase (holo-ACP synthase)